MNIQTKSYETYDYEAPLLHQPTNSCQLKQAWAKVPVELNAIEKQALKAEIKTLLQERNAVMVAHYYVEPELQDLALETGGCVGDSLEMARFGQAHTANELVVAGVRFMGESAKILSPEKTVLMPDLEANCSLDLGCPADEFDRFCNQHPDRTVMVYANTSAAVKARADWVVTSSVALEIATHLAAQGQKLIWGPDRHLGNYIQRQTGAEMLLWQGSCMVHNEFKADELAALKIKHPQALVLVHPESPAAVVDLADVVGSTSKLLKMAVESAATELIVATDLGILHEMRKQAPHKIFIAAPTAGESATCKSCAFCPWMAMNSLVGVRDALLHQQGEIVLDPELGRQARVPLDRMLAFAADLKARSVVGNGIGPA